ncbi:hypothetical protein MNBD_GAMMA20-2278 [hydrothermal vent metagenome]|uniref:DUF4136 domain-containing protein n=1 Tax=hydrothermal vent metagenome TaxID=652676 RepID=A0A3B1A0F9_9ZZZZ
MRTCTLVLVFLSVLGLTACGSQSIKVSVDSIVGQKDISSKQYTWLSGMRETSRNDLYFREFSRYFQTVLYDHGYQQGAGKDAPVIIYFSYGVSPGRTTQYTTTTPIYDWEGGDTIVYTETKKDKKGKTTSTVTSTVTTPARQRLVGMSVGARRYTVFTRFVTLEAKRYQAGGKPKDMQTLWKTSITSTGSSNDLRALMPIMATASAPYIGVDSGETQVVKMKKNDPRVVEFKQRVRGKAE